jgi:hypothetical protein
MTGLHDRGKHTLYPSNNRHPRDCDLLTVIAFFAFTLWISLFPVQNLDDEGSELFAIKLRGR